MTNEDRKAFEEWKAHSGGDHIYVEKWRWAAWQAATARERERCAGEARAVQTAYEHLAHRASIDVADRHNAAAQAALEISIAIRATDGGNTDDR